MKTFNGADLVHFSDLPKYLEIIEKELINILPIDSLYISDPVRRLINAKSKRIRPSILLGIVANLDGEINDEVISACVAIELVHIASLIHDDIVDHANTRWLIPTINSKEGLEYAVIIGDYIFAKANEKAASVSQEVALVIARTIALICDGEARELTDEFNINRSMSSLIKCIEGKTAALISAACNIGGLCSGLPSKDIYALNKFGYYFGISFQFIDDLLDFLSNEKILGKAVANDVREGVYTMPTLLGINNKE